jgi:hypothetical protein
MEWVLKILTACAPILVALVGIIPAVVSNRKKTQESIKESQESAKKDMVKMQTTLDNHIREDEDEKARNQRYRILRFYDEMCEHRRHSESHFEDILDDIDDYEKYCEAHPEFRNNRGKVAMEHIKVTYGKIKASGGFLTHDNEHDDA